MRLTIALLLVSSVALAAPSKPIVANGVALYPLASYPGTAGQAGVWCNSADGNPYWHDSSNVDHALVFDPSGYVPTSRTITTTAPIQCGGATSCDMSVNRTLALIAPTAVTHVLAGLGSGPWTWVERALIAADIPSLSSIYLPLHSKADTCGNADTVTDGCYLSSGQTISGAKDFTGGIGANTSTFNDYMAGGVAMRTSNIASEVSSSGTTWSDAGGGLVIRNPDTTAGNWARLLFGSTDSSTYRVIGAGISALFLAHGTLGWGATDLVFHTARTDVAPPYGPQEHARLTHLGDWLMEHPFAYQTTSGLGVANNAAHCTGSASTLEAYSQDAAGVISLNCTSSLTKGYILRVTFARAFTGDYGQLPVVTFSPSNAISAVNIACFYVGTRATTYWDLYSACDPDIKAAYQFQYHVVGLGPT